MFLIDYKRFMCFYEGCPRILREDNFFCAISHHKNGLIYQHKIDILHIPFRVVCKPVSLKIFNFIVTWVPGFYVFPFFKYIFAPLWNVNGVFCLLLIIKKRQI